MESESDHIATGRSTATTLAPALIGWGIAAIIGSIVVITVNNSAMVLGAGIFMKILAGILGSVLGLAGALIGDVLRRFAQPDAWFITGGFFSLISTRLFWLLGPQVIGLSIGVVLGCSLILG